MRLGIMGIKRDIRLDDWSAFRDERLFNKLIAQTGEAVSAGRDIRPAAIALVKARNPFLMEGALAIVDNCADPSLKGAIRREIIDVAMEDERVRAVAVRVITDMAAEDYEGLPEIMEALHAAEDNNLGEVAMLGLLNGDDPRLGEYAGRYLDHPNRTARSLAMILRARHADRLEKADLDRLGEIASGAGRVDSSARAIAAWLWLNHSEQRDKAMTRIVGDA